VDGKCTIRRSLASDRQVCPPLRFHHCISEAIGPIAEFRLFALAFTFWGHSHSLIASRDTVLSVPAGSN
jgi:hypothetical protein